MLRYLAIASLILAGAIGFSTAMDYIQLGYKPEVEREGLVSIISLGIGIVCKLLSFLHVEV